MRESGEFERGNYINYWLAVARRATGGCLEIKAYMSNMKWLWLMRYLYAMQSESIKSSFMSVEIDAAIR